MVEFLLSGYLIFMNAQKVLYPSISAPRLDDLLDYDTDFFSNLAT
jgi:hypothetical protein